MLEEPVAGVLPAHVDDGLSPIRSIGYGKTQLANEKTPTEDLELPREKKGRCDVDENVVAGISQ